MALMNYEFPFSVYKTVFIYLILLSSRFLHQCKGSQTTGKLGVHMVRSPESAVAPVKDEVLFECELNLEPDRLEWRFRPRTSKGTENDYVYLSKNDGFNITTYNGISKLRVYVSQNSVGEYQCVAWFGASALASIPAKLMLAAISLDPKSLDSSSNNNNNNHDYGEKQGTVMRRIQPPQMLNWRVHPGNTILIKCGEIMSNPPPIWNFYKDNLSISPSIPQLSSGTLILQSVTQNDSGTYSCSAVNSITGTEIEMPQKVAVSIENTPTNSPKFLVPAVTRFMVKPGATAILECPGIGNPVPKAVWSRPDAGISNNRTSVIKYGLQIINVIPEDRGTYVCRLDNGIAPALVHNVRLEVLEPPRIINGPPETLTNESASLELECAAKGYPFPEIYWMINGADTRWDPLIRQNGSKLIIKSVEKKHAGIVQCFAKNDVGEVNESNLLQVKPKQIPGESSTQPLGAFPQSTKSNFDHTGKPPKGRKKHKHTVMIPPSRPSVTRLSDEKVMVRWSVPSKEGLPIQFFKVQYRMLGDPERKVARSQWMTSNEDIPPQVKMYEVDNLKPNHYYRFRIAAVYSNNDNKLSNVSAKFLLLRGSQLGPTKSHLIAPNLTRVEPISETAVVLHWLFPSKPTVPVDGFYAYYRPASTAGEYSKATVEGMGTRHFKIDNLEAGTAYEFKLQSFTSSAASDFIAIITGKTLKPSTPKSLPTDERENEIIPAKPKSYLPVIAGSAAIGSLLVLIVAVVCFCIKRKRGAQGDDEANENKTHPEHIQAEMNGFPGGNGRVLGSPIHKSSRLNGVPPRMNITSNPLAQEADKNRNVMELRFLPNSLTASVAVQQQHQPQNNNCNVPTTNNDLSSHRRTLERSTRNLHQYSSGGTGGTGGGGTGGGGGVGTGDMMINNKSIHDINAVIGDAGRVSSIRRPRRSSGSAGSAGGGGGPGSPRVVRGLSSELLHNRSPMPARSMTASKRNRLGSRTENMSSGSLNSIEV